ncbi:hypothetical protein [Pseudonocardia sp. GCM10023141]|uniref:hypothetical protein n=1 Tax=Pseudonocardia sp. GCM10023141 TaxID=3252653 RepID=UPI0036130E6C
MTAAGELLAARTASHTAVVAVVLRSARWPYSCGLAHFARQQAQEWAAAGAEVLVGVDEPPQRLQRMAAAWGLSARLLPAALVERLARELDLWDGPTGRADDGIGLLAPDGAWIARWDLTDPFGEPDPATVLSALPHLGLPPAPPPPAAPVAAPAAGIPDRGVCDPAAAAQALRRARASAVRTTPLMDTPSAAARTERAVRLLGHYLDALDPRASDTRTPDPTGKVRH